MDREVLLRRWQKSYFLPDSPPPTDAAIIAQVMDVGGDDDVRALEANFSRDELITALQTASALSFRPRSWGFWHFRLGLISMAAELPNPPRWDIDATAPEDVALQAIPPEQAQAAIEWLGQINQVTAPPASPADLATYLVDDDRHRGDPVHELAFALKDAGILSKQTMGSLLARYVKYRFFRDSQMKTKSHHLADLLAQCDAAMPLDAESQAWLNSPPVGLEIMDVPRPLTLDQFIRLLRIRTQYWPDQPLEISDLANAIGLTLGNQVADKDTLLRHFDAGFRHGVNLITNKSRPDWLSFKSIGQEDEPK